jgi:hypothetical protein
VIDITKQYRTRSGMTVSELRHALFNTVEGKIHAARPIYTQWNQDTGKCVVLGREEYDLMEVEVTNEELFETLNKAEEMSLENWRMYRTMYNAELGKLQDRIKQLEDTLERIEDITIDSAFDKIQRLGIIMAYAFNARMGNKKDG